MLTLRWLKMLKHRVICPTFASQTGRCCPRLTFFIDHPLYSNKQTGFKNHTDVRKADLGQELPEQQRGNKEGCEFAGVIEGEGREPQGPDMFRKALGALGGLV